MKRNVMLDTSVILEGLEGLKRLHKEGAELFVTDIVLQELDGKKSDERVGYHARSFFRALGNAAGEKVDRVPGSGAELRNGDTLWRMRLSLESGEIDIYTLVRKHYRTHSNNDSRIIEVAKDYGFTLVTFDTAQKVRAMSEGVDAIFGGEIDDAKVQYTKIPSKERWRMVIIGGLVLLVGIVAAIISDHSRGMLSDLTGFSAIFLIFFGFLSVIAGLVGREKTGRTRARSGDKSTWESNPVHDEVNGVMDYGYGLYD